MNPQLELERHREFLSLVIGRPIDDLDRDLEAARETLRMAKETEARFQAFFDNSPHAVSIQDPDGRYVIDNRASALLYEHTTLDTRGKLPHEVWPPAIAENVTAVNRRVRERRQPVEYENEVPVAAGIKHVHVAKFPIVDANGQFLGIGSIGSDITLRKQAEERLRQSRQRFLDFAESSSDWFWEMGSDLRFSKGAELGSHALTDSAIRQLDKTRNDQGPQAAETRLSRHWQKFWELARSQRAFRNVELPYRGPDRAVRYLRISAKALRSERGDFLGYRGVATDVTEAVENQRQAAMLRDAVDESSDAVILYDEARNVVFTNKKTHRIFPMLPRQAEIAGMTREALLRTVGTQGGIDEPGVNADPERYVQETLAREAEDEETPDERRYADGRTYVRTLGHSGDAGLMLQLRDVTERKRAELEVERYQAELRRLASEVSLAEEKERRRISTELHDGAVQNLGLARITLGTILKDASGTEIGDRLAALRVLVDQSIRELRSLMSELSPPMLYELGLEPAIDWLAERFRERHELNCSVVTDDAPKPLDDDVAVLMFQAVRELLMNVVKHANATRAGIELRRSGSELEVIVDDDGKAPMPGRIEFNPTDSGGFGLFNVRERLRLLHGELKIEPGNGTRVTLRVPLAATDD